jgi:hypothetical protein
MGSQQGGGAMSEDKAFWVQMAMSPHEIRKIQQAAYGMQGLVRVLINVTDENCAPDEEQFGEWVNGYTMGGLHAAIESLAFHIDDDLCRLLERMRKEAEKNGQTI